MSESSTPLLAATPYERRARRLVNALSLALALGACSSGWLGRTPDAAPDEATVAPLAPVVEADRHTSSGSLASPASTAPWVEVPAGATDSQEAAQPSPVASPAAGPSLSPELHRLRHAAQQRVLGSEALPSQHPFPYAPPGLARFVAIEQESALGSFHRALARLAAGEDEDGKVRILAYGASHTQADGYPGYLRAYLQGRFGDGGQGFVLLGRVNGWYRTLDTAVRHRALSVHHARYRLVVKDEPLGLFGAALVGRRGDAFGEIVTAKDSPNTRFEVHYFKQPGGGDFSLYLDGKRIALIETKAGTPGLAHHAFQAAPGRHQIRAQLHGNGPVRLFGVVAETAEPGVVVDTLGIGGARMASNLSWDEGVWIEAVRHRKPDLVSFAYGTNEAADESSLATYEREVRAVLARLRKAAPQVSCLLIGPFDVPQQSRSRLLRIVEVQRRVSKELDCGFWDGHAFMGGAGSIKRWASAKPPLASPDHVHLTRLGYVYAGTAIGDALMRAYDGAPVHSTAVTASVTSKSASP